MAKPFLKWAGGKGQLLATLDAHLPEVGNSSSYFEPFLGGGAVFFHLKNRYPNLKCYISDFNPELILCYLVIRDDLSCLINILRKISEEFPSSQDDREAYFYNIRDEWNSHICKSAIRYPKKLRARRVAMTIFMNKTCFNGLFRVNSKGEFNTPFGRYKNPKILDEDNLKSVSKCLDGVTIKQHQFNRIFSTLKSGDFVYFDPPYRPLPGSPSFTSYTKSGFSDFEQKKLARFCDKIAKQGVNFMLSNSDPSAVDPNDRFFDEIYHKHTICRVLANRAINSNGEGRKKINEILVKSY